MQSRLFDYVPTAAELDAISWRHYSTCSYHFAPSYTIVTPRIDTTFISLSSASGFGFRGSLIGLDSGLHLIPLSLTWSHDTPPTVKRAMFN